MKNTKPNLLDRAIAAVAPRIALRRQMARQALALGGYNGASHTRPALSNWSVSARDADSDINPDLPALRARTRDLARNAPLAGSAIATQVTKVVGTGLSFQSQPDAEALGLSDEDARAWADHTEREFRMWFESTYCDATRTQNGYGLQSLAFRSALESGDVFAVLPSIAESGWPYRLAIQLVEADRICNPDNKQDTDKLVAGIELNDNGAPVAVHICDRHPGNLRRLAGAKWQKVTVRGSSTGRKNVIHLFDRRRPGQVRGVPCLAPVIEPLKQLQRYTDAELQAAVISGMFAVFVKMDPDAFNDLFDENGQKAYLGSGMNWDGSLGNSNIDAPGKAVNLLPGEDVVTTNPGRPNAMFDPFVLAIVRQVGAALEIPFEVLIKHFNSSYSAARAALLDAWQFFRGRRDWLATYFCQPIFEAWLEEAVAIGRIQAPGFFADAALRRAWCMGSWVGDGPGSIDPAKEVAAARERVDLGISTIAAESILHDGVDWRVKHKQRVIEESARRDLEASDENDSPDEPATQEQSATILHHHVHLPEQKAPQVSVQAIMPEVKAPDVNVAVQAHMPEQAAPTVDVHVEAVMPAVEASAIHIEAVMPSAPAPNVQINVEPTPVTLEATVEAVAAPAQVVMQRPVSARQTVEHDPKTQEIVATVTTYEYDK
ncbi:MAG: phage portal protein [Pseudomonas sp.]|nr:phage portal protein [Pseudomonas sp.]